MLNPSSSEGYTQDEFDSDPFDFTGRDTELPNLVENVDWNKVYNWAPGLEEIQVKGQDRPRFVGRKSDIAQATLHHLGRPLRLDNHAFMIPIYNNNDLRIVLKCSRQISKTVHISTRISTANGSFVLAKDIKTGDKVATMATDGHGTTIDVVTWVSDIYRKQSVRIHTRQGHIVDVALTHPMRVWDGWKEAGFVNVGERLAVVRKCGVFNQKTLHIEPQRIRITAYLIGDGYISRDISFTSIPGPCLSEFLADLNTVGGSAGISTRKNTRAVAARLHRQGPVHGWMKEDGLADKRSASKFVPSWVFDLSRTDTAMFLNRIWSTDGHVKQHGSMSSFGYSSISRKLVLGIQALLWKFGIPSKVYSWIPNCYVGSEKKAYSLRIETQEGARKFLSEIGCLGKSTHIKASSKPSNNNRDTYPIEIGGLVNAIVTSRGNDGRRGRFAEHSLRAAGLQEKLNYPPTKRKLSAYVEFFREDNRYNKQLVDQLQEHIDTDLYWDAVIKIEDLGVTKCIDFEVAKTHCFIANGFVTHNSTTICNLQITEAIVRPHWRSLYVSPSALQTRQYSNEKLRPTIYESPFLRKVFVGKGITDQVFEKTLLNGSYMFLRYAFLTAARARGIPASRVFFDEAQDLLKDNIKVISQSLSASRLAAGVPGSELLAGTPLTFSNTLEEYWQWSTQNEWLVPCDCVKPRYWNFLDDRNIGKKGLICSRCGKPLNAAAGQWISFEPGQFYAGYHISQLMVPWKQSEEAWHAEILLQFEKWPQSKFQNEILGFSFDNASSPITRMDVQRNCWPNQKVKGIDSSQFVTQRTHRHQGIRIFAGIDWGEGREEGEIVGGKKKFASWTVLTIGGYLNNDLFWPFLMKRYVGKDVDPELILPDLIHLCGYWNVEVVGADWGHGWGVNSRLFHARGRDRVMQFAYSHSLGERKRWDADAYKFIINRNAALSQTFEAIKQGNFLFPEWEVFEPFAKDILAEYVEYNERTRTMIYDHPIDQPDDALHSLVYCKLAADISMGRF